MFETSLAPSISHDKPPAILSLIGDTPLVEITQLDTGPCRLFLKLENQNPGGSIKDRIALSMIGALTVAGTCIHNANSKETTFMHRLQGGNSTITGGIRPRGGKRDSRTE